MKTPFQTFTLFSLFAALVTLGAGCLPYGDPAPLGMNPQSGVWSFHMEASSSCIGGGLVSNISDGEAIILTSHDANIMTMSLDNQLLVFYDQPDPGRFYQTAERTFPVQTPDGPSNGTALFEAVANTPSSIVGNLHWDNGRDCIGDYPFTMELIAPDYNSTGVYDLRAGTWSANPGPVTGNCPDIAQFDWLADPMHIEQIHDFDTGEFSNTYRFAPLDLTLEHIQDSNQYVQTSAPVNIGPPTGHAGEGLFDYIDETFLATFELEANNTERLQGFVNIVSDSCTMTMPIQMSRTGA